MDAKNLLFSAASAAAESTPKNPLDKIKKKYEFTGETMEFDGHILHRIRLLDTVENIVIEAMKQRCNFGRFYHVPSGTDGVKEIPSVEISSGMIGGWIEKESNLSQSGCCFVFGNAKVYGDAKVKQRAMILDNAVLCDKCTVTCNASVHDNTCISGEAYVGGNVEIFGNVSISGHARILCGRVCGNAVIMDDTLVNGRVIICGDAKLTGSAEVRNTSYKDIVIDGPMHNDNGKYNSNNLPPADINVIEYNKDKYTYDGILLPKCSKENKKYIFTGEYSGMTRGSGLNEKNFYWFQIQRICDGKIGGYIQSEDNLSYEGDCWVDDEAVVCMEARVSGNAVVEDNAEVYDNVQVSDNARVSGYATIQDDAKIYGNAVIMEASTVTDDVEVYGNAIVTDDAFIQGDACICGNAIVAGEIEGGVYDDTENI